VKILQTKLSDVRIAYTDLDSQFRTQNNLDSIKWDEFERMADQMKQFTRSMSPVRHISARLRIPEVDDA